MKTKIFLSLLLFGFTFGQAQEESKTIVTTGILTYVKFSPSVNLGVMHKVGDRVWLGAEGGIGVKVNKFERGENYRYYEIRPEVFYDLRPNTKLKHLVSAELFYIKHNETFTNAKYNLNNETYRFDRADYERTKIGGNINYTLMYYFSDNFGVMQKVGLGVRNRNVEYSNVLGKAVSEFNGYPPFNEIGNYRYNAGSYTTVNFDLAFRLFYKF